MSSSKTIAKNTLFLYFRMFLIMGVTLYTSRVVLQQLGVSDFGIYSLVGGIVAMLGFFNAAMSSATQRYLSFDIGKGDFEQLQKTFSATLTIHILIAVLALVLAETIGLWYINYKMVFPQDRLYTVNVVYQFSILTFLLNIIQVPYNSLILARERMSVYAYVSILEAILKLAIVFLLVLGKDKLKLYAIFTFFVALIIRLIYQIYCRKQFKESKYKFEYDKSYLGELLSYSGWNLFGNLALVSKNQGVSIVLNLFYGTIINAAYGIAMQIHSAVMLFVQNFQMALNPQIIKNYANGNKVVSIDLVLKGMRYSFFLIVLIVGPFYVNTEYLLKLWLGNNVPDNTIRFIELLLVTILVDTLSGPLMTIITATGRIRVYQIIIGSLNMMIVILSYLLLKENYSSSIVFVVGFWFSVLSFFLRFRFVYKYVGLSLNKVIREVFYPCLIVLILLIFSYFICQSFFDEGVFLLILTGVLTLFIIFVLGVSKEEKKLLNSMLYKINK